jgi:hypothetical protein
MRSALAAILILTPDLASAQTVANSFEELRQVLKNGQTVIVTDASGRRTKGKVADLPSSPSSLVLLVPEAQTFAEGSVVEIRATDSLRNGALIGGGIGMGLAMWDYLIDPSEPGNAVIFAAAIGVGTAIGMGIDAVRAGGRVLYHPRRQTRSLTISPLAAKNRRGVLVSIRF